MWDDDRKTAVQVLGCPDSLIGKLNVALSAMDARRQAYEDKEAMNDGSHN